MPPCHPTFEVIAFHAPVVESGVLRQVIHTDTGLRQLVAPVEIWRAGLSAVRDALAAAPSLALRPAAVSKRPESRAATVAAYRAALADFQAGNVGTKREAAVKHGVRPANFYVWLTNSGLTKGRR